MSKSLNLQNLADLEKVYVNHLDGTTTDSSVFVQNMILREYKRDINDPNLFAICLKLCGNNRHMGAVRLTDLDIPPICAALLQKPCITVLDLRYNRVTDTGASAIAAFLKEDEVLEELNLMGNDITEVGASELASSLKTNNHLVVLKMTGNPIGTTGGLRIAQALQINNTLEFLDLGECDQTITSCIALITMLRQNKAIRGINLNRQLLWTLQEEPTVHIADMLCVNSTLKELHLAKVDMRDSGAERISEAMDRNQTLELLDISGNRVARDGAISLSRAIMADCSLVILDLAFNRIQCAGALALASALPTNTRLKVLAVQFCELKGRGLCALAEALITNVTLKNIYIWGNEHDESTCIAYSNLLETERLTEDCTDVRPYVVDGRVYLALMDHDNTYRQYRFSVPWWKGFAPKDRSVALF
ncbi:hypothetical protein EG68_00909 [Paragonimus skrjabini miyazakii]|uniref:Leucine-rich repeat-containing protein 34 n=1 Tax=Paragonimus skrjabini miyazakii TaxID=59628 RepID=A0A8S9Z4M6_9TREM|nr:hypothetical protein EG68_00909 [Paragonimus skrjabini miyazakii]